MKIDLPYDVGDEVIVKMEREAHVAKVIAVKLVADRAGIRTRVKVAGIFGVRSYNDRHFGTTLCPLSDRG